MVLSGHDGKVNVIYQILHCFQQVLTFQITSVTINFKKLCRPKSIRIDAAAGYINIMCTNPWRFLNYG